MSKNPVIWLTGMSGSGKTTLANYLKDYLKKKDIARYRDLISSLGLRR